MIEDDKTTATATRTAINFDGKFIVKYRQYYYDITNFLKKHPGGINTLNGLNNGDMTYRFMTAPPHSEAAMYLLGEYKIDPIATDIIKSITNKNNKPALNGNHNTNTSNNRNKAGTQRLVEKNIELIHDPIELLSEQDILQMDGNNNNFDDSMEYLVDWSKAMLPQISKITKHYNEWVHKPVDRELHLLSPWYLEMFTKTPWWLIPSFWLPIIIKCEMDEFINCWQMENNRMLFFLIIYFFMGIVLWTILEYSLHRWVFHMSVDSNSGPWLCTIHFMIHGLHHKVPFDANRLVFPPLPGAIIASTIYLPLSCALIYPRIITGGCLFGYVCYDLMHYYLHHGNPRIMHFYNMKRYHYQHHFAHQQSGYGISSPLWDIVFDTRIYLRKLKYSLRWK